MIYSRRDLGKIALATMPLARAFGAPNSKINGVEIGVQSYSFRSIPNAEDVVKAISTAGLSVVELMSNHAEALAGAPQMPQMRPAGPPPGGGAGGPGGPPAGPPTAEQMAAMRARMNSPEAQKAREDLRKWRQSATADQFKQVRKKFDSAGIDVRLLCFNLNERTTNDEEIEYAFMMAKALGVKAITTSTQLTVAKKVAPFADKNKMMVGYHGHDNVKDPNEFSTPETFATAMSYSKYNGINLDIGHFTATNHDPIPYIKEHHDRITNLHLKDRKKDHGPNTVWGQGDTPIKEVLLLMKKEKYPFPANIEYEYRGEADAVTEVGKCVQFCREALS